MEFVLVHHRKPPNYSKNWGEYPFFPDVNNNTKVIFYKGATGFSSENKAFSNITSFVQKISPKIISVVGTGDIVPMSSLTISFTSNTGSNYAIERSRDLVDWVKLAIITGENNSTEFTDDELTNIGADVFYRVREQQ